MIPAAWIVANPWRAGALATAALAAGLLAWGLVLDARLDAAKADGKRAAEAVTRLVGEIDGYMAGAEAAAKAGRTREAEATGAAREAKRQAAKLEPVLGDLRRLVADSGGRTDCPTDKRITDAIDALRAAG